MMPVRGFGRCVVAAPHRLADPSPRAARIGAHEPSRRSHFTTTARTARSRHAAFTLIEVIIAVVITALVLGVAAGALSAATTARARVLEHQTTLESESRFRAMLTDMLQHAPTAEGVDEPMVRIGRSAGLAPSLTFLSTGVREPFGTGRPWRVTVSLQDAGVTLDAVALGPDDHATLHSVLPDLTDLEVRVLEAARAGEVAAWRDDWPLARSRPAAVELRFTSARATSPTAPLIVSLAPLEAAH